MRTFRMKDVERIEKLLVDNKTVEIEWHTPYEKGNKIEIVNSVRWDGLVFTTGGCVFTGIDKLVEIREIAQYNNTEPQRLLWQKVMIP